MEQGGRALFDASAYMLLEASGDSEAEHANAAAVEEEDKDKDDDARSSCSSTGWVSAGEDWQQEQEEVDESSLGEEGCSYSSSGSSSEEGEGEGNSVVDQGGSVAAEGKLNNSKACEDDRLFWEACLAS